MPIIKGLEWSFDAVASTYEKLSAGYVTELYQTIEVFVKSCWKNIKYGI